MRKNRNMLIIDVESTCWHNSPPKGQVSEIIEIGIIELDLGKMATIRKSSILVQPQQSKISDFCTALTTITQEQVGDGLSLADACYTLRKKYKSKECVWGSWGDYDRRMFEKDCRRKSVKYPFGSRHINIKTLFAIACRLEQEIPMMAALDLLGKKHYGTLHRGDDDAWHIAEIFKSIFNRKL